MTNVGITGREISKKLHKETIRKGGLETINLPILETKLTNEHDTLRVQFGGYKSFIHYNKFREQQHRKDKFNQKIRATNRNIKQKRLRQSGLTHHLLQTGVKGDHNS
jgi:hypothetical protein